MKRAPSVLLPVAAILAAGCGHMETHQAMLRSAEPPTRQAAELYMADRPPPRAFYEIALVQAIGFGSDAHPEDIARALAEKGASLGCDAVVRVSIDVGYSRAHGAGVCVRWLGPGPPGAPAALPPDRGTNPPRPNVRPAPAPKIEPFPSNPQGAGGPS